MSESGETPEEQAKRLRIALADQDAMLAQAAEMGQAVVNENMAMKERIEQLEAEKEEADDRAALAEVEREEAKYSLAELYAQRKKLEMELALKEEEVENPALPQSESSEEVRLRAHIQAEMQAEQDLQAKLVALERALVDAKAAQQKEVEERQRIQQEAEDLRLLAEQEQSERQKVSKQLRSKVESEQLARARAATLEAEIKNVRSQAVAVKWKASHDVEGQKVIRSSEAQAIEVAKQELQTQLHNQHEHVDKLLEEKQKDEADKAEARKFAALRALREASARAEIARLRKELAASSNKPPQQPEPEPAQPEPEPAPTATPQRREKQGYAEKKGGVRKNWLVRYFELVPSKPLVYREAQGKKVCGVIELATAGFARRSTAPEAHAFELELESAERTFRVRCTSDEERDGWIEAISLEIAAQGGGGGGGGGGE